MAPEDKPALPVDPGLSRRIDALARKTAKSRDEIVREALEHGRSLAWQEKWVAGVEEGLAEAERGEFASPEAVRRVLNKHRPT